VSSTGLICQDSQVSFTIMGNKPPIFLDQDFLDCNQSKEEPQFCLLP